MASPPAKNNTKTYGSDRSVNFSSVEKRLGQLFMEKIFTQQMNIKI